MAFSPQNRGGQCWIDLLPAEASEQFDLILDEILDNFSDHGDDRKLTSFSKPVEVALRHAGTHAWLIELEISPGQLLDSEPFLEKAKNEFSRLGTSF